MYPAWHTQIPVAPLCREHTSCFGHSDIPIMQAFAGSNLLSDMSKSFSTLFPRPNHSLSLYTHRHKLTDTQTIVIKYNSAVIINTVKLKTSELECKTFLKIWLISYTGNTNFPQFSNHEILM